MKQLLKPVGIILMFLHIGMLNAQAPFWTQTFTGGIPSGWTSVDGSNQNVVWKYCASNNPGCTPLFGGIDPFQASTASTGYVYVNSDAAQQLPQNHVPRLTSTAINCTGKSTVFVQFQSHIGTYLATPDASAVLRVSTNLNTWTTFKAFPGLTEQNEFSANPHISMIDISSVAANQATVYLQWQWTANYEYMWNLDDVAVFDYNPTPDNDLVITDFLFPAASVAQPASQIATDTFPFFAFLSNVGLKAQNNIVLKASVTTDNDEVIFSDSILIPTLAAGVVDSAFDLPNLFAPNLPVGAYKVKYEVRSDATDGRPADNRAENDFYSTQDIFSKEDTPEFATGPADPGDWYIGNLYRMSPASQDQFIADQVQFSFFSPDTTALPVRDVEASIYLFRVNDDVPANFSGFDRDALFSNSLELVGYGIFEAPDTAQNFEMQSVTLLDDETQLPGVILNAGARYIAAVGYTGDSNLALHAFNDDVLMTYTISTLTFGEDTDGTDRWFLGGFGPENNAVVRMTIALSTTTDEKPLEASVMQILPNPVSTTLTLGVTLEQPTDATITIADMNGRVIQVDERKGLATERLIYPVSKLASGTYLVRMATKDGSLTKKFVIQR